VGGGGDRQTAEWYAEKGIEFVFGRATSVNLAAKSVAVNLNQVGDTAHYSYGKLIIATGSRALRVSSLGVSGDDLQNVFYIRQEAEAALLVKSLELLGEGSKAIIVGGGYIGLECAAALVGWGIETTLIMPGSTCMPRLFNKELGDWFEQQYAARGINIIKEDRVTEFMGDGSAVTGVQLKSGRTLACDIAIVGVGGLPNSEFCTGLAKDNGGFVVDAVMQTSDPDVFAIGDVCSFPSQYGGLSRCEHVDHARKSAAVAVKAAMGLSPDPYRYLPYFYSRVFEYTDAPIVFNFFGSQDGECRTCPWRGNSIGAIWVKDGKVVGALLMGSPGPNAADQDKLRDLATRQPAGADAASILAASGL